MNFFSSTVAKIRRRPDLAVFTFGLILFAGGLVNVIGSQVGTPEGITALSEQSPSPEPKAGRVGPNLGEDVAAYVNKRKALAAERASKEAREPTYGIVVFNSYRKATEVEGLMKARGLEVVTIQTRIPVEGFKPNEIPVNGRSLVEAALDEKARINQDLEVLQGLTVDVTDADFKKVYAWDLARHQEALTHLVDDPATIFAVVVKGTNASLGRTVSSAQVRYVDLPDDPTATPDDSSFAGLVPEDTKTASSLL